MFVTGSRRRNALANGAKYALLVAFAIPWIVVPFWMLVVNSFKTEGDANVLSLALPEHWAVIDNYATVINEGRYVTALTNSLLVAVPTILIVLLLGTMAAWVYARSKSLPLRIAFYATALSIVLPPAIIPTVFVLTQLGIEGSRVGYVLTLAGARMGLVVFLSTGFLRSIPLDFEDAAQIDGASHRQIYWHVILPLLRPIIFTGAVILIISIWNDFFFALYLLPGNAQATLPLTLYGFATAGVEGLKWNLVFAHVILVSLPVLLVYLVLQRQILSGLTEGGVTG